MKMPRNATNLIKFYRKFGIQEGDFCSKICYWLKILALFRLIGFTRCDRRFRGSKQQNLRTFLGVLRGQIDPQTPSQPFINVCVSLITSYEGVYQKKLAMYCRNRRFGDFTSKKPNWRHMAKLASYFLIHTFI